MSRSTSRTETGEGKGHAWVSVRAALRMQSPEVLIRTVPEAVELGECPAGIRRRSLWIQLKRPTKLPENLQPRRFRTVNLQAKVIQIPFFEPVIHDLERGHFLGNK